MKTRFLKRRPDRQVVRIINTEKHKDERARLGDLKKTKDSYREQQRQTWGRQSNRYKKQMKYIFKQARDSADAVDLKYTKKIAHLKN